MNFFQKMLKIEKTKDISITGLTDEFFAVYLYNILVQKKRSVLVVTSSLFEANQIVNNLNNYTPNVFLFPMDDFLTSEAMAISPEFKITRLELLKQLQQDEPCIIVTNLMGFLRYLPSPLIYKEKILSYTVGQEVDIKNIAENLYSIGYERQTLVTKTGEVGVRGFVVDIFPLGEQNPVRLEFFGDTIESIRYFDAETQKSLQEIDKIDIYPCSELLLSNIYQSEIEHKYFKKYSNEVSSVIDYIKNSILIYKDYQQLLSAYKTLQTEIFEYKNSKDIDYQGNYMNLLEEIKVKDEIYYYSVDNIVTTKDREIIDYNSKQIMQFNENIELIQKYLRENIKNNKTIIICLKTYQINNFIKNIKVECKVVTENSIEEGKVNIIDKTINHGFSYQNYIVLSENELFKQNLVKRKYKTNFRYSSKINDYSKLNVGDYVVHNIYGVGIYNGLKTLTKNGLKKDYLEILYYGKDKLYIPVEKIEMLYKYIGKEGTIPKLNKLSGSDNWQKTKDRIRNKVKNVAKELIQLYAKRQMQKGYAFSEDTKYQIEFEEQFPYMLTKDQFRAIQDIKKDMESSMPMDRLLCGDVGYGKTEVAFRATFKAIADSKQVMFLCPTTILSNQHYDNALARFQNFPVNIALLNRFTSVKETKRILQDFENGLIDFLIGTHRILSDDVRPKDLGLLIIDEEQRFGVGHKEKIKKYKTNVDVLTLTATPIPRTLQMSMVGIRSLSLIETPPVDRYPVQTYVVEENKQIMRDAIYKELSRDGQVFILYNRVESIERKLLEIQQLIPEAKIVCAHGQMSKAELENKMWEFIHHEYDILICTTIIETGIDIPNVNTLIVLNADCFGLSQLYQIRGRVGRSNRIAYAYLMYQPTKVLTESATKRLNAIKEFTKLGSGFSIATRDLSIRGAGDILGNEQAGFIDTVGIDLYLKILNEEVQKLQGKEVQPDDIKQIDKEAPLINVETHISDDYVQDTELKIEIHEKINEIDSFEKLKSIKQELEDRFGHLTEAIIIYMYEEWFESLAKKWQITEVNETKNYVELVFSEEKSQQIDVENLFVESFKITPMFRLQTRKNKLVIILDTIKLEKHPLYYILELLTIIKDKP